jgi:hypothetical protein
MKKKNPSLSLLKKLRARRNNEGTGGFNRVQSDARVRWKTSPQLKGLSQWKTNTSGIQGVSSLLSAKYSIIRTRFSLCCPVTQYMIFCECEQRSRNVSAQQNVKIKNNVENYTMVKGTVKPSLVLN